MAKVTSLLMHEIKIACFITFNPPYLPYMLNFGISPEKIVNLNPTVKTLMNTRISHQNAIYLLCCNTYLVYDLIMLINKFVMYE